MSDPVSRIINHILAVEGSTYTNDPADPGGPTKYGITLATLSAWRGEACTPADVEALTADEARQIYQHKYVVAPGYYNVMQYSVDVAAELVDSGVNLGTGRASRWLQRSLNVLNRCARDYNDIAVDGIVGGATIRALSAYLATRPDDGETVLLTMLNCLQGAKYVALAERRERNERFVFGWFRQRVVIEARDA